MATPEAHLKEILFAEELRTLQSLEQRYSFLESRVGSDPALRDSVRRVIIDVLVEAGVEDAERLATILSPLVIASIRQEIRNSTDMMVDALYPITGRLVAAAVRNALSELMQSINERLDEGLSAEHWRVRIESLATGRPRAEVMLKRHPPFQIDRFLVIHSPTGLLIAEAGGGIDPTRSDLIGSMISAILTFAEEAIASAGEGSLQRLNFEASTFYLQASPSCILAVKARGTPPRGFETGLSELFCGFLDQWGSTLRQFDGQMAEATTRSLVGDVERRFAELVAATRRKPKPKPSYKAFALVTALGMAGVGWAVWEAYEGWRLVRLEEEAAAVVAGRPELTGYPVAVVAGPDAAEVKVTGLVPDAGAAAALRADLRRAMPGTIFAFNVVSLPARPNLGPLVAAQNRLQATLNGVVASVARIGGLPEQTIATEAYVDRRIAEIPPPPVVVAESGPPPPEPEPEPVMGPEESALRAWVARNTPLIFQAEEGVPPAVQPKLRQLARLLAAAPSTLSLAISGYTARPAGGGTPVEAGTAMARVVADMLIASGVPASRVAAPGGAKPKKLAAAADLNEDTHQLEFRILDRK